jgi:hypothetical protein
MSASYLNMMVFIITTIVYYLTIKPNLSLDIVSNQEEFKKYTSNSYMGLAIFGLIVIVTQFLLNMSNIMNTCGGNVSENIGPVGLLVIFPWLFIFGVLIIILTLYPGFKSAFSDVIGYYFVASSANNIISELLIDKNIQHKLDKDNVSSPEQKSAMQEAAQAIIKVCGNSSILINQIVPVNFDEYWDILTPLMKSK